jgi:hypothetical protein
VWLTPTRTRQAFQAWPNLGINPCVCVLCSVLCAGSLSYSLLIYALQYLYVVQAIFEVQGIFKTGTSNLVVIYSKGPSFHYDPSFE